MVSQGNFDSRPRVSSVMIYSMFTKDFKPGAVNTLSFESGMWNCGMFNAYIERMFGLIFLMVTWPG